MRLLFGVGVVVITLVVVFINDVQLHTDDDFNESFDDGQYSDVQKLNKTVEAMKEIIGVLGRQILLQQLFAEERIRSEGDSGVKQVRLGSIGTRNYYSPTHTSRSVVAMHDHSNNDRTVGMGEFIAVLNGVEFRTRHNDYRLYMPHRTKKDWHAVEPIPFPDVPPEVLSKQNINEQVKEMQAWFRAWRDQDHSTRDYRKYFRPVLCYLEGTWTTSASGEIEEPFESDRHFVDASSWFDLQEKVRFTSYTGRKDNLENFSFLPSIIMNVTEDGYPKFAQWNYRILCHPISRDLPLSRLRVIDELGPRLSAGRTFNNHVMSREARFQVNVFDRDEWKEGRERFGVLDELMSEIPGMDNYPGNITDDALDLVAFTIDPKLNGEKLRADRYHRWFDVGKKDAMGVSTAHRGFSDGSVFMALNTQPKVAGMSLTSCRGTKKKRVCKTQSQKMSYAVPLEIIYLTPLSKWNPYDIHFKGVAKEPLGRTVEAGGRNGDLTDRDKAYNGTNSKNFYQTPVEFFSGNEVGSGAADTTKNVVGVLDKKGIVRECKATGTRIFFPVIADVGVLRQRYPIVPVHGEGSAVWKELEATKDLLLKSKTYGYAFREPLQSGPAGGTVPPEKDVVFQVPRATTKENPPGPHTHDITLTADQVEFLTQGGTLYTQRTSVSAGHDHKLDLEKFGSRFLISRCDASDTKGKRCWDYHGRWLVPLPNQ